MPRAVFNGEPFVRGNVFGINRNTIELLLALDKICEPNEYQLVLPPNPSIPYTFSNIELVQIGPNWLQATGFKRKLEAFYWRNNSLARYCRQLGSVSVNTDLCSRSFVPDIISIYDCRLDLFPQYSVSKTEKRFRDTTIRNQKHAVKRCKTILTDSESAKVDIARLYHVDESKISVIPCGWQHFQRVTKDDSVLEKLGLVKDSFFFTLGSRLPHKNVRWVTEAAKQNPHYRFVVSGDLRGANNTRYEGEKLPNMLFPGYLSDGEVKSLMFHCKAFIHPSFYEGFGIPPMEAMSVGADCIVSRAGSLPEVYQNSVWYIDPSDYKDIDLDKITSRPKDSNERVLERFSWEKSAQMLKRVVESIESP